MGRRQPAVEEQGTEAVELRAAKALLADHGRALEHEDAPPRRREDLGGHPATGPGADHDGIGVEGLSGPGRAHADGTDSAGSGSGETKPVAARHGLSSIP